MEKQHLLATLEKLRDELAGMQEVDDQTRAVLAKLTDDIQRVVGEGISEEQQEEPLSGRVEEMVQEFGAEHPGLASALNQLSAALANLGI